MPMKIDTPQQDDFIGVYTTPRQFLWPWSNETFWQPDDHDAFQHFRFIALRTRLSPGMPCTVTHSRLALCVPENEIIFAISYSIIKVQLNDKNFGVMYLNHLTDDPSIPDTCMISWVLAINSIRCYNINFYFYSRFYFVTCSHVHNQRHQICQHANFRRFHVRSSPIAAKSASEPITK